ncbi:hypothetical protein AOC36_08685 [Erysipelothrix larvae]|uniref:non-specific protein-tyrosine kinase n=1 Tax=Erysipelothrix larvae TaxID=1514105 RepID=A0A0X8H0Y4_9FIRM|nr:CpsD/CapB family tyrosine-protein kinase [Erysipelothrix larvae]AMC94061.1 hypothetical protein AOC36_08685 [Erysipelothrix larvae]
MFRKKAMLSASNHNKIDILDDNSSFSFVEGYRSLRTNLSFMTYSGDVKTILVSSSLPGEGKSSVSVNLARSLSMAGKKVLLIDADLRSPSVHKYLRIRKKVQDGFSTVLAGRTKLEDAIYMFPPLEIDVMLSGSIPPNASELLSREHTGEIMSELKEKYDVVIIDTPPAGVVTDAVVLSRYVDGLLFIVKQNYAEIDLIKHALKSFEQTGTKVLGVVMSDYKSTKDTRGSGSYAYDYTYGVDSK